MSRRSSFRAGLPHIPRHGGDLCPPLRALFLALVFGPQLWVTATMRRHGAERPDYPGTGGELARHLLDEAGLQHVKVERIAAGDHYAPDDKAVRLSAANFDGRSVTAVAVAAHEVGHALQHAEGYRPLMLRQRLAGWAININRLGAVLLMATPVVFALRMTAWQHVARLSHVDAAPSPIAAQREYHWLTML